MVQNMFSCFFLVRVNDDKFGTTSIPQAFQFRRGMWCRCEVFTTGDSTSNLLWPTAQRESVELWCLVEGVETYILIGLYIFIPYLYIQ